VPKGAVSGPTREADLKKRILAQGQGEAKHQPTEILSYFEELMCGFNAEIEPKDFFETASK
jgi:hypothetical protein